MKFITRAYARAKLASPSEFRPLATTRRLSKSVFIADVLQIALTDAAIIVGSHSCNGGPTMRRLSTPTITIALIGFTFGILYRYLADDPNQSNIPNYLRSGLHGSESLRPGGLSISSSIRAAVAG
jgi:hypothetical protein